jgi:hypothetical protein
LANPQAVVLLDRDEETLQALLTMVWQESVLDLLEDEDENPDPDWETEGWDGITQTWYSPSQQLFVTMRVAPVAQPVGGPQ